MGFVLHFKANNLSYIYIYIYTYKMCVYIIYTYTVANKKGGTLESKPYHAI